MVCFNWSKNIQNTRDVFYVRRVVNLIKTAKINACIMYIFGKIELLSIHAAFISQYITLITSMRQRHAYISDTGNMIEL